MNRNKRKILILSDLNKNSKETISYAISVAKEINGALELLCVKKPGEFVTTDNPLSAMRDVSMEFVKTEQKAKNLVRSITKNDFFPVKNTIEFGNVKTEIEHHIERTNPDFIVLGKKQKRRLSFNGDNLTDLLLKKYTNKVLISGKTTLTDIYAMLSNSKHEHLTA